MSQKREKEKFDKAEYDKTDRVLLGCMIGTGISIILWGSIIGWIKFFYNLLTR